MLPIPPALIIAGGVGCALLGRKLVDKRRARKKVITVAAELSAQQVKSDTWLQRIDKRYQDAFQNRIDPLFGSKQRGQQIQEFAGQYSEEEADINRRLGYAVTTTHLAVLGATMYTPLSWLSAGLLVAAVWDKVKFYLSSLIREKRVKYWHVATLAMLSGLAIGYYVVSSLMTVVFFSALKLTARTEAYSKASLIDAFTLQPPGSVWVQQEDGLEIEIAFNDLKIDDIIVLSAGQTIPVDGCITSGMAGIDQHILTGEAQPVERTTGDLVFANTLILAGKLYVQVKQTGKDTAAAQIGHIFNNMDTQKLEQEARSEQLADRLTLPLLAASGLASITVGPVGAAAILNSGFGSTLIFSGPLSTLSHLNLASHHGILVKDGRSLEKLYGVDTVVFDKTGTLTMEQPEVGRIHTCDQWSENDVLYFAAIAEHRQTHPIAKAILTLAEQRLTAWDIPDESAYSVGFGIAVRHQGDTIQVGSQRFMHEAGVVLPNTMDELLADCQASGHSLVFVAINDQCVGALELQAQIRADTEELIHNLHERGLKLCILSGDHQQPTQHLARRLGIDQVFAEVLPEGKADILRQLQDEGRSVCFVGDGINDAIALKQADVSVSLRGATSVATDSAQIVLMGQSLQQLDQLFQIADSFDKNLTQTMRVAYVPGAILVGGVFLLHFGMTAALVLYGSGVVAAIGSALSPALQLKQQGSGSDDR